MTIGKQIKEMRNKQGMTMEQLAKQSGLAGRGTIDSYESGRRTPHLNTLGKIAKALGCELEILLKDRKKD